MNMMKILEKKSSTLCLRTVQFVYPSFSVLHATIKTCHAEFEDLAKKINDLIQQYEYIACQESDFYPKLASDVISPKYLTQYPTFYGYLSNNLTLIMHFATHTLPPLLNWNEEQRWPSG